MHEASWQLTQQAVALVFAKCITECTFFQAADFYSLQAVLTVIWL